MVADTEAKDKDSETKEEDKRPKCPLCGQGYDPKEAPILTDKCPIPTAKAKLIATKQADYEDALGEMEDLQQDRKRKIRAFARTRKMNFQSTISVEVDPREKEHQDEFFFWDPVKPDTKVYLDEKATKKEIDTLRDMSWAMEKSVDNMEVANNKLNKAMRQVATDLGWIHRPLQMDGRGNFISQNVIEEAVKKAKEETEEKCKAKDKK